MSAFWHVEIYACVYLRGHGSFEHMVRHHHHHTQQCKNHLPPFLQMQRTTVDVDTHIEAFSV